MTLNAQTRVRRSKRPTQRKISPEGAEGSQEIAAVIREELKRRRLTPFRAARIANLPENAIRTVLDGHEPRVGRLVTICQSLGLDVHVGPRRPLGEPAQPPNEQPLEMRWSSTKIPIRRWKRYSDEGYLSQPDDLRVEPAPAGLEDPDAFYAIMAGHSMAPEYIGNGYYSLISPNTPLDAGQRVWLRDRQDREVIRRLVAVDVDAYSLRGWREPDPLRDGHQDPVNERCPRTEIAAKGMVLVVYADSPALSPQPIVVPDVAAGTGARAITVASSELAALVTVLAEHHEALNEYGRAQFLADLKHHFPVLLRGEETRRVGETSGSEG